MHPAGSVQTHVAAALPSTLPFWRGLSSFGSRPALIDGDRVITYGELDRAVESAAAALSGPRRLVGLAAGRRTEDVVLYLASLRAGLPVLMLPRCRPDALNGRYAPEVLVADGAVVRDERPVIERDLHPELALLLTTSGSTGSPRVVRLSYENLAANADSIASALELTPDDRAATTLELSYSYGLSVLTSHLQVGAAVVLTELSVTDPGFARLVQDAGVTTLAAVPYTFDLLDRVGTQALEGDALRQVTCAGGRLPAASALRYDALGREHGWELVPMYGATEATARMAVLPGHLTSSHPDSVGYAVAGGCFRLEAPDADGVGDLVYSGPNVMLGYATEPADLALGRVVHELATGDRGRFTADGLLEVVGRREQVAKVHGLRVDLADVDAALGCAGLAAVAVALDGELGVVVAGNRARRAQEAAAAAAGLPLTAVRVASVADLPRTDSGKPDRAELERILLAASAAPAVSADGPAEPAVDRLRRRYEELLGCRVSADSSFVDLGGDSLSFVAVSLEVEAALGFLPRDWHALSVRALGELAGSTEPGGRSTIGRRPRWGRAWTRTADSALVLRAVAIALVVASHASVIDLRGGAHVLMAIVGYNLARFHLGIADPAQRMRRMATSALWVLVPSLVLMAALTFSPDYEWYLLGATSWVIPTTEANEWRYWFVEALLWLLPLTAVLLRVWAFERLRRRAPWAVPAVLTLLLWGAAQLLVPEARPAVLFAPLAVAWLLFAGWTIAAADTVGRRAATSVALLALMPLTFEGSRLLVVPALLLALVWIRQVPVPSGLLTAVSVVAEASLMVYLTHWLVLTYLPQGWAAVVLSFGVGIVASAAMQRLRNRLRYPIVPVGYSVRNFQSCSGTMMSASRLIRS